jgi:hypothetical protein
MISSFKSLLVLVVGERIKKEVRILSIARSCEAWVFKELLQVIVHVKHNNSLGAELLSALNS